MTRYQNLVISEQQFEAPPASLCHKWAFVNERCALCHWTDVWWELKSSVGDGAGGGWRGVWQPGGDQGEWWDEENKLRSMKCNSWADLCISLEQTCCLIQTLERCPAVWVAVCFLLSLLSTILVWEIQQPTVGDWLSRRAGEALNSFCSLFHLIYGRPRFFCWG